LILVLVLFTSGCATYDDIPALCEGTTNGAMLPSSLLQKQQMQGKTFRLSALPVGGSGCGQQQVISSFDSEHTLNALLVQPETKDLGFIHIPLNAGGRIEAVGLEYGRKWGFNAINHTYVQKVQMNAGEICSWFVVPPRYLPGVQVYTNKPLFCVTRDPYERLFATYLSIVQMLDRDCPISEKDYAILSSNEICTPASLNNFVSKALSGSQYDFDCNLMPQYKYIWDWDGKQVCTEMLQFEELPTALPALLQKYNITLPADVPLPSLLQGSEHTTAGGTLCPGLSLADLDVKSKLMIAQYYRDDFEMLGYEV
jgi:hypothetical protein